MLRCAPSLSCFVVALSLSAAFLQAECWVGHDRPFNSTEPRDISVPESQGDKTLTLTILDESDKPIPRARFSYFGQPKPHPAKTHRHYVQADEHGKFTIRLKSNVVQNLLEIQVDHPGYAPYNATWEKPQTDPIPNEYTIKLEPAETVGGIVLDDAGKPLPGADVEFCVHWRERSRTPQVCSYRQWITTDENGRWSCNLIPPAMFPTNVHLHVMHKGFMNYEKQTRLADMKPNADGTMKHRVVMDRGITVKGRVTDEDGRPVVGASVFGNYMSTREDLVSKTDENGEYTLPNWPESNTAYIGVWKQGKRSVLQNCVVTKAAPPTVDIVMKNAGTPLRVKIVDKDGKPVPGFMIAIERWGEHRLVNPILLAGTPNWAKTGADGLWTWNEAPENEVVFDMMKGNSLMDIRDVAMTAREEPYVFTAYPPLKISGEIVDADTGVKIPEFKVYLGFGADAGSQLHWEYQANAGKDGAYSLSETYPRKSFGVKIEAEGYEPGISRRIEPSEGKITIDFSLRKLSEEKLSQALHGTVLTPDGKPAAGAQVALSTLQRNHQPFIDGGRIRGDGDTRYLQKSDKDGTFRFPYIDFEEERKSVQYLPTNMKIVDYTLTLLHETGFRQVGPDEMRGEFKDKPITLEKWGRIEGVARVGTKPGAELPINFHPQFEQEDPPVFRPRPGWGYSATSDVSGRFVFESVPRSSGLVQQGVSFAQTGRGGMVRFSGGVKVEILPGETATVQLGGKGKPVTGKLVLGDSDGAAVNWNFGFVSCRPPVEKFDFQEFTKLMEKLPKHVKDETDPAKREKSAEQWKSTPEGKVYFEKFEALQAKQREWSKRDQESRYQSRISAIAADGTFRLPDVTEGEWMLEVELNAPPEEGQWQGKPLGRLTYRFTMPAVPGGVSDEAIDLGTLTVPKVEQPKPILQVGQTAPEFEIDRVFPASEGTEEKKDAKLKLSDFKGKYVILEFWATWCVPCVQKLPELKKLSKSIKGDPHVVLVGISFDNKDTKDRLEKFLSEKEMDWPQGLAGNLLESPFPGNYGVSTIPALLLIAPDGKVLLSDPSLDELHEKIEKLKNDKAARETSWIAVCGDDKVLVIDEKASKGDDLKIVWSWKSADVASQIPEAYQKRLRSMDECKPVDGGKKLLLTSSGGAVLLLEKETKKCLFYAHVPNAHSADLLPDNKIVVALSTHPNGNSLEVYDISRPERVLFKDGLHSGHGAVWMPQRKRFYALGYDVLREYSLKNWDTSSPELVREREWTLPVKSGHDLSPRSANELLVSGHEGVRIFDIDKEEFRPFEMLQSVPNVKSVNVDVKTGRLLYTKGEEQWWTFNIYLENPVKTLRLPDIKLYKARFFPPGD